MEKMIGSVTQTFAMTNTSGRYLVVGNHHEIISHHATRDEALDAYCAIGNRGPDGLAETKWAVLNLVAPGESTEGVLVTPIVVDDPGAAAEVMKAFFGERV